MPNRFSKDFQKHQLEPWMQDGPFPKLPGAQFFAYKGGDKPKRAKVTPIVSAMDKVNNATFSSPFGSGISTLQPYEYTDPLTGKTATKNQIVTDSVLTPELTTAGNLAQTGLNANLAYLQRDPLEQVNFATSGQDPYYNTLNEQAQRNFAAAQGRARVDAQKTGGLNSTTLGANLGMLGYNKQLLDNQILLSALQYGNNFATQNVGTNLGVIGDLNSLVTPLGAAANTDLMTALQDQSKAQAATAEAMNQAERDYVSAMNTYNQNKNKGLGSGIGTLAGAGLGALLAIPTGGLSIAAGTSLGMGLGSAAGSLFDSGGGGGSYVPNFASFGGYSPPTGGGFNFGGLFNRPSVDWSNTRIGINGGFEATPNIQPYVMPL